MTYDVCKVSGTPRTNNAQPRPHFQAPRVFHITPLTLPGLRPPLVSLWLRPALRHPQPLLCISTVDKVSTMKRVIFVFPTRTPWRQLNQVRVTLLTVFLLHHM